MKPSSLIAWLLAMAALSCGRGGGSSAQCPEGAKGCPCLQGLCQVGLRCISNACVDLSELDVRGDAGRDAVVDVRDDLPPVDVANDPRVDAIPDTTPVPDSPSPDVAADVPLPEVVRPQAPWFACSPDDAPAGTTVVTAFDRVDQYFDGNDVPGKDRRQVDQVAEFPAQGQAWQAVLMRLDLECPADGQCDRWDRFANVFLVKDAGSDHEEVFELARYVTPYGTGLCAVYDVTPFVPLLEGARTVRSFIDTWVGPHFQAGNGHGWRVSLRFVFYPGPVPAGAELVNLWPYLAVQVGDPANPIDDQIGARDVPLGAGVTTARLRLTATGHGQGNAGNCAEFCQMEQVVRVNGTEFAVNSWRGDCASNPNGPGQGGTWQLQRNGFCPGAVVIPHVLDVSSAIVPGQTNRFEYRVRSGGGAYVNSCRPGQGGPTNTCQGCVFDGAPGNCEYNTTNHTPPNTQLSVQLFVNE